MNRERKRRLDIVYRNKQREWGMKWRRKNPNYLKKWKKLNPNYFKNFWKEYYSTLHKKLKRKARQIVNYNLKLGKIIRPMNCKKCHRKTIVEAHHNDYTKPLRIKWLCRKCHLKLHFRL